MTVEEMVVDEQPLERPPLAELVRKVLLAGIGAAVLAQEEAEALIQKLIEKGELAEKDGRWMMKDLHEKRRKKVEGELDKRIVSLIERMKLPTKSDIEELSDKITAIATKVDQLKGK